MKAKPKPVKPPMIYFSPYELKALQMSLGMTEEHFKKIVESDNLNWTDEGVADMKKIIDATHSAADKIEKVAGFKSQMTPLPKQIINS